MSVCCTRTTSPTSCPLRPDAACRDEWALFDATISADRGRPLDAVKLARIQALAVCDSCPALGDCRTWLDSLPPSRRPAVWSVVSSTADDHPAISDWPVHNRRRGRGK